MKLHQIVISGNKDGSYPNGFTYRDFNLSTVPFFQFILKGLGRGKNFLNIKKLNIILNSDLNSSSELINYPDEKGNISTIEQGGFNFESYFEKKPVDRIIELAETTKGVLTNINPASEDTDILLKILDDIIQTVPKQEQKINEYLVELNKMMKQ